MIEPIDHPLLRVDGLGVTYPGGTVAVHDVSFQIGPGELVAVVGPNGAGKSSLFRAVCGLVPHDGDVEICGTHCHHRRDRLGAAYIPQRNDLDPDFPITVGQVARSGRRAFVGLGRRVGAGHRRAATAALETVGLADHADRPLATLSGGQAQRALLARALAQEARMLLLDEALSGIDHPRTEALFDLFERLVTAGASVLVATHDLHLVSRRFTRCLAVNRTLVADGHPADVLASDDLLATFGGGIR